MIWSGQKKVMVASAAAFGVGLFVVLAMSRSRQKSAHWKLPAGQIQPAIVFGYGHGVVLAPNGSLWSWGEQELGWAALGLGNVATQACLRRIGSEKEWRAVAAGNDGHNLALKSDGTIWGWGANFRHQLGANTNKNCAVPFQCVPGNDWKQVAAGGTQSLSLKMDGTLWAWGINWAGQLGIGTTTDSPIPVQVGAATNWVKAWAGGIQTIAMQADGTLWFWGGDYSVTKDVRTVLTPTRLSAETNWVDVGFGTFLVFAIKSDGTLWAWGHDADIFTRVNDTNLNAMPMQVGTNNDWQACSSSDWNYDVFQKKDGSLWCLDWSNHKIIKPREQYPPVEFKRIVLDKKVVAFGAGHGEGPWIIGAGVGAALTEDGEVWTWGKTLGRHTSGNPVLQLLAKLARRLDSRIR